MLLIFHRGIVPRPSNIMAPNPTNHPKEVDISIEEVAMAVPIPFSHQLRKFRNFTDNQPYVLMLNLTIFAALVALSQHFFYVYFNGKAVFITQQWMI